MGLSHTSANGVRKKLSEMTHQHLSNCVWHFRILRNATDEQLYHYLNEIEYRFEGNLLMFRPLYTFEIEINALRILGMIVPRYGDEYMDDIIWRGVVVGEVFKSLDHQNRYEEQKALDNELKNL